MVSRTGLLVALILASFIGVADAWYLADAAMKGASLVCDFDSVLDGCNIVAQSPYSRLFGIPLALYGVVFYGLSLVLSIALLTYDRRWLYSALVLAGLIGFLASAVFLGIQLTLIQALCIYCIVSAIISSIILVLSLLLQRRYAKPRLGVPEKEDVVS